MRTTKEEIKEKNGSARNYVDLYAQCAHSAHMPNQSSTYKGYTGGKKRTNLSLDGKLVEIATKHFPATRHGSLSGFVENAIRKEFKAMAPKLRKAGFKLPPELFDSK